MKFRPVTTLYTFRFNVLSITICLSKQYFLQYGANRLSIHPIPYKQRFRLVINEKKICLKILIKPLNQDYEKLSIGLLPHPCI